MCLCYLFSAKTAWQLVNRKADFFTKRIDSNRFESIRIANWNALLNTRPLLLEVAPNALATVESTGLYYNFVVFLACSRAVFWAWSGAVSKVRYQFRLERSNEYRIKQTIKRHYDHTTRPVRNDKTAVNVLVAISLYHILDTVSIPLLCGSNCLALCDIALWTVASLPALGPWAPPPQPNGALR